MKLFFSFVSLAVTSFALAFGVFSATTRAVTISGTISYTAQDALVQIAASIVNGFQDDDGDSNLQDINPTRHVTVRNFTQGVYVQEEFYVHNGNSGAFITDNRWNIGSMYFNPSPNVVPSNQTPGAGQVSATIQLVMVISNYSTFPVKVEVSVMDGVANPISEIGPGVDVGYDLSDAQIASIAEANIARTNVSSATSKIYFKLNNLVEMSAFNFGFRVIVSKA